MSDQTQPEVGSVTWTDITVENLNKSITACKENGGAIVGEPRNMGDAGTFCVIRDPSGAVAALFEPAREAKE